MNAFKYFTFIAGLTSVFFTTSCNLISAPKVNTAVMASNFNHAAVLNSNNCASCHDVGKTFDGYKGLNGTLTNQMLHNFTTLPDCSSCHLAKAQTNNFSTWNMTSIANSSIATLTQMGAFHTNISPTSCASCHSQLAPPLSVIDVNGNTVPAHTSAFLNGTDCVTCHSSGTGLDWTKASATGHTATQTNCAVCHITGGVDPTKYNAIYNVLTSQMMHTVINGTPDCYVCHRATALNNSFTSWNVENISNTSIAVLPSLGPYHNNSSPTSCSTCHSNLTPTTATTDYKGNPVPAHTSTFLNGVDCVSCHSGGTGLDWTVASSTGHTPNQINCASCHAAGGSDPTKYLAINTTITNEMLHTHGGLPDCYSCHLGQALLTSPTFSTWLLATSEVTANGTSTPRSTLGVFHTAVSSPTSCQDCHSNERPKTLVGNPPFDHTMNGTGDCISCHTSVPANIGLTWVGGQAVPANISVGNFTIPQPPAPSAGVMQPLVTIPHPTVGNNACSACHSSGSFTPAIGFDHSSLGSSTCASCHEYGSTHMGTPWPASQTQPGNGDTRPVTMTDLGSMCNQTPNAAMKEVGPHFYGAVDANNNPMDCKSCHNTPSGIVTSGGPSKWGYNHPPKNGDTSKTPVCAACHQHNCGGN